MKIHRLTAAALITLTSVVIAVTERAVLASAPTVVAVSATTASGGYGKYDNIDITVQFSAAVTVTGTPTLALETGESDANASYLSGSTTDTLTFRYTVGAGHAATDLDYKATTSLSGGTITLTSNGSFSATRTLPSPGTAGSLGANRDIVIQNFIFTNPQTNSEAGIARDPASGIFFLDSGGAAISSVSADGSTLTASWIAAANSPDRFQVVGDTLYWNTGGSTGYKAPIASKVVSTWANAGKSFTGFARHDGINYIANYSERKIYKILDASPTTATLVSTLPAEATGVYAMYPSASSGYVLALDSSTGNVYSVNTNDGTYTVHANLDKCDGVGGNAELRGMVRLADGTEYFGFYSPSDVVGRRATDGTITCPTLMGSPTTYSYIRAAFQMTADSTALYTVTSIDNMDTRSGFLKLTPNFSWGGAEVQFSDSGPTTYSVTYNGNTNGSGSVPIDSTAYSSGATVTVAGNTGSLAKTGYTFGGWCTTQPAAGAACGGTSRAAASTFAISSNTTLYAVWTANTLNVTTDEQSGDTFADTTTTTGASMNSPGTPTRTGYTFAGWSTTSGGSAISFPYTHGQTADFTLYALWTASSGTTSPATTTTTTTTTTVPPTTTTSTTTTTTTTTVPLGSVGINSWTLSASQNPVAPGQRIILTTTISCGRQMSTSARPYYPSMYYMVRSSPWINGVYGGPTLSSDRRTATFSVAVTAPSQPGNYAMYAYGRDNPTGGTCTGDSYNFANSRTFTLTVGDTAVLATTTTLPEQSATTSSIVIRTPEVTTTLRPTTTTARATTTTTTTTTTARRVTICHSTGSATNPYVSLSVDASSLNGHRDHENDIIPAPSNGCPRTLQVGANAQNTTTTARATTTTARATTTTAGATTTTEADTGNVGINSWTIVASPNPAQPGEQVVLTTTISCGRRMSTTAPPYYPSMYYMVRSSPWINGVYRGPSLSADGRTATFSVTVTAPGRAGTYSMYAYGRDNPFGRTCTGDSYNFANSSSFGFVVTGEPVTAAVVSTSTTTSTTTTSVPSTVRTTSTIPSTTVIVATSLASSATTSSSTTSSSIAPSTTTPIYGPPAATPAVPTTLPDQPPSTLAARPEVVPDPAFVASDGEVEAAIQVVDSNEIPSLLSVQGRLVLTSGNFVKVRGKGFERAGFAEVWLYSTPQLLGRVPKDETGNFVGRVRIPEGVEEGEHTVELRAVTRRAKVVTVSVPAIVLGDNDNSTDDTVATTVPSTGASTDTATTINQTPGTASAAKSVRPLVIAPGATELTLPLDTVVAVVSEILGNAADATTAAVRVRVNASPWQRFDIRTTSEIVLPLDAKSSTLEIEVTPEGGQPIIRSIAITTQTEGINWTWWFALALIGLCLSSWFIVVKRRSNEYDAQR